MSMPTSEQNAAKNMTRRIEQTHETNGQAIERDKKPDSIGVK